MKPIAAAALGVRPDDPSIIGAPGDPFLPDLRHPPVDWFFEPPDWFEDGTKIWIDSDGRAAGWYYQAGVCIIDGNEGDCWSPSPSPTGNELFHQGSVLAMDGDTPTIVETGVIGGGGEHAPAWLSPEAASDYYADVSKQVLIGRIYDDPNRGGYFLGCILPDTTNEQVDMIRRSSLSGDWRWRKASLGGHRINGYDALGPWLVTRPGLPLARTGQTVMRIAASVGDGHPIYVSSICGPVDVDRSIIEPGPEGYHPSDEGDRAMWHIEQQDDRFAVIESKTGTVVDDAATVDEAGTILGRLYVPQTAAVSDPEPVGDPIMEPTTAATTAAPPAAPAVDESARIDELERRVSDLEAQVAEMLTEDLTVDELMPPPDVSGF